MDTYSKNYKGILLEVNTKDNQLKVRIPSLHGGTKSPNRILDKDLPWISSVFQVDKSLLDSPDSEGISRPLSDLANNIIVLVEKGNNSVALGIINNNGIVNSGYDIISDEFIDSLFSEDS